MGAIADFGRVLGPRVRLERDFDDSDRALIRWIECGRPADGWPVDAAERRHYEGLRARFLERFNAAHLGDSR